MALPTLKSILGKRSETTAWLQHWASTTKSDIVVEDSQHTVLFGNQSAGEQSSYPVILDGEIAGYVKGTETAAIIAPLLSLMLQKETEKKKLGTEVLNLYQELNVIYNFSEKLTETIDPDVIAQLTLEQALHSIPSHSGVIVLWDEEQRQLTIPAISGESLFNKEKLQINSGILLKIGLSYTISITKYLIITEEMMD